MLLVRGIAERVLPVSVLLIGACQAPVADHREANKQVVRELYAAIDAQDFDRIKALSESDMSMQLVGTQESVPFSMVVSEMIPMYFNAFPDYHHVVEQLVAEDDWVVARVTFSGTHEHDFQGIPPTGNAFTYGGVHMARIVDGRIREFWLLEDDLGLMRQLGMDLAPKSSGS